MVKHADPLPHVAAILDTIRPLLDPEIVVTKTPLQVHAVMEGVHKYLVNPGFFSCLLLAYA